MLRKKTYDALIVGSGIAGSSLAYELSVSRGLRVGLVDMEAQAGYHSTGRSAALFAETYGPPGVQALTVASRSFLENAHGNMFPKLEYPILTARGVLWVSNSEQDTKRMGFNNAPNITHISKKEVLEMCPALSEEYVYDGFFETGASDMDVTSLHNGFNIQAKYAGTDMILGRSIVSAKLEELWKITDSAGEEYEAKYLVNAAGAWGDHVSKMAGIQQPFKLTPKKRTVFTFSDKKYQDVNDWPFVANAGVATHDTEGSFYFKPQGNSHFLASPSDATPWDAVDTFAEDMDIAICADTIQQATNFEITRIESSWAGLRTFSPDGEFVLGPDIDTPSFIYAVGQGGYGIQTAPAAARTIAELMDTNTLPQDLAQDLDFSAQRFL